MSSAIVSTCPAHCSLLTSLSVKLLCTPVSSAILLLSALVTLAFFLYPVVFTHLHCCCKYTSVSVKVSVPCRHVCVTQVFMTLPFSLFEIRRSAITPSIALHTFAPACTLRRTSLSVFQSPHTALPRYTRLSPWVSFFPSTSMSSSPLWWPRCSTPVFSRLIVSLHQGQVVCIEEFRHGILRHCLPVDEVQYCYEHKRALHAVLSQSNLDLKLPLCSFSHHHSRCCLLVHAFNHPNFRF